MFTNFIISNQSGEELPYAIIPFRGKPGGVSFEDVEGKVGIIRLEYHTHVSAIAEGISMLGCIPDDIDFILLIEYSDDPNEKQVGLTPSLDEILESHNCVFVYDMQGKHPALIPTSAWGNVKEKENTGPTRTRFTGNLSELACSKERVDQIENDVLDLAKIELVKHILTDRIAVREDIERTKAKNIFDCLVTGKVDFPISIKEIDDAFHASSKRFIDVFRDIDFSDDTKQEKFDEITYADSCAEAAIVLWDWSLRNYGCPFTIRDWKILRNNDQCWQLESMNKMAELIGFDIMFDSFLDGIPLSDLVA